MCTGCYLFFKIKILLLSISAKLVNIYSSRSPLEVYHMINMKKMRKNEKNYFFGHPNEIGAKKFFFNLDHAFKGTLLCNLCNFVEELPLDFFLHQSFLINKFLGLLLV